MSWRILQGDVREVLASLPDQTVQTCVTSPPYWGLRDYGAEGQIGLEHTPDAYMYAMRDIFRDVRRVLRDDGTLWVNLGDSYAAHPGQRKDTDKAGEKQQTKRGSTSCPSRHVEGLKAKDLVGIPWRVAFALQADGWYLRSDIIWHKPNPMPESVTDRPTKSHEYVFLLAKQEQYYFDAEAIQEDGAIPAGARAAKGSNVRSELKDVNGRPPEYWDYTGKRNSRSVWTINTQPYPEAHFATFPEELPTRCIKAGSRVGDVVLDPFCGAGTTGLVADRLNRDFIGIELNPAYIAIAEKRISSVTPLLDAAEAATDDAINLELFV